jgi:hypothetical protein
VSLPANMSMTLRWRYERKEERGEGREKKLQIPFPG